MRWFIVILLLLVLIQALNPWLHKLGLGRLPGDLRFVVRGRQWYLPITSTIVLSAVVSGLSVLL